MQDNLLIKTLTWLLMWRQVAVLSLLLTVLVSAVGVTISSHITRQLFASLQSASLQSDELESEYEKLLLEQSAWADYSRLDQLARDELKMRTPLTEQMVVVEG